MWTSLTKTARTLRFRLTLWNAVAVLLTATAILVGLRAGVRYALYHELDQLLAEDTREIILLLDDTPLDAEDLQDTLEQKARGHHQHHWFATFLNAEGREVWASASTPSQLPNLTTAILANGPITVDGYRVRQQAVHFPAEHIAAIRVGASIAPIEQDLAHIDRQVMFTAGLILLIAPLCGYWLAGRATSPVAAMIRTASELRPSHLEDRLPLRGTEDELDQLASTINGLLDRIALHLERRHDFLANAAHDLRTPLAAIRSSIEVTLNEQRSAKEYQELLAEVIEESSVLEILVNQLLILSETEGTDSTTYSQLVSLDETVRRSVEMFEGVAESRGIHLTCDTTPCIVKGNREYLRQLVNNLLDNSVKFTPSGGNISVSLAPDSTSKLAVFKVADSGGGILPEDQPHIFERFFRGSRAQEADDGTRGTGLGLSICQAVVNAHGGTISVESIPGKGSTFTAVLPLSVA